MFQIHNLDPFENTPLVVDGIMYTTDGNDVVALDAARGRTLWVYNYTAAHDMSYCCAPVSRGLAILGNTLFLGAVDARLIALDAKNGHPLWDVTIAKATAGYSLKGAPIIAKDKVVVGTRGGEHGIRGFIAAYDAGTGKEAWRFNTVAGPGEPGAES